MSDDYSREAFDAAFAEEAAAAAFGRGPRRVTEADQQVARAFGRPVPELTEAPRASVSVPGFDGRPLEVQMAELIEKYRGLRISRLGDSAKRADALAGAEEALIADLVIEGGVQVRRVRNRERLRKLQEKVAQLEAEVPLSAESTDRFRSSQGPTVEEFDSAFGGHRRAPDGRRYTQAEVDESIARAFGRTTKGDQR
ncbi:hypothetical protein IGS73_09350 [Janibacter indicus]|uniref:Uncharacterized protein n=1 Tax=Janibacter indicus TaxID=857417 RepID=A0A7L9IVE9_9MICO|nr:hypothetical protein [Janibacter indicus]QOK21386.1 hypothetical protein IGS73_09350 [Janibacter indicus]